MKMKLREI